MEGIVGEPQRWDEGSQEPACRLLTWCGVGSAVGAGRLEIQAEEPQWMGGRRQEAGGRRQDTQAGILFCGPKLSYI